jgi:hypothetical protein
MAESIRRDDDEMMDDINERSNRTGSQKSSPRKSSQGSQSGKSAQSAKGSRQNMGSRSSGTGQKNK